MSLERLSFDRPFEHDTDLFACALEEFGARGYDQASINTILQRSGMSKGQFYYHFHNKEELYLALIGAVLRRKQEWMRSQPNGALVQGDIFDMLLSGIATGVEFARAEPAVSRFIESIVRERANPIYARVLETYNFNDGVAFDHLVDRAIRNGELRDDLPAGFVKSIIAFLFTHAIEAAELDTGKDMEDYRRRLGYLVSFLRDGLARRSV